VGASTTAGGAEHAFSWTQAGAMVDLGTLHYQNRSFAQGVNDDGQIVGYGFYESGGVRTEYRAFSYTPARGMVELVGLPGGNSVANAVSDSGDVVGTSRTSTGAQHAVLWHLLPVAYPFLSCLPQPVWPARRRPAPRRSPTAAQRR
jgi:probable HAF family extracellular repeat protein